jgi:putative endonuclease
MVGGFVYFMSNRRNGTLYVGVTSDLIRRCYEHRNGLVSGFTKTHGLKLLVYFEQYDDIRLALQREKNIKHWLRAWKVRLIHQSNPDWNDLYDSLN